MNIGRCPGLTLPVLVGEMVSCDGARKEGEIDINGACSETSTPQCPLRFGGVWVREDK